MRFFQRLKLAWQVFLNRGILVEFNEQGKKAVLHLSQLPTEGDTLTVGDLVAEFKKKPAAVSQETVKPCHS